MKDGFIRVAAATPDLKVADPVFNREQTWKMMQEAASQDVKILVFPELGLTGYTCSDLFLQDTLIDQAKEELLWLLDASKDMDMLTFIGLPDEGRKTLQRSGCHQGWRAFRPCSEETSSELF